MRPGHVSWQTHVVLWRSEHLLSTINELFRHLRSTVPGLRVLQWLSGVGGVIEVQTLAEFVDVLQGFAEHAAQHPGVASLALRLRGAYPADEAFAAGLLAWVQTNIRWLEEPGERFTLPHVTLQRRVGDCDDLATLTVAIALAGGLTARVVAIADEQADGQVAGTHACAQVLLLGEWRWVESSWPTARVNDDPRAIRERAEDARVGAR